MTSPSPGRQPGGGRPAASQANAVLLRSARCGAWGQLTSKSIETNVSADVAASRASRYAGWIAASALIRKRVPTHAPAAPSAKTATRARASAMPPAAITGTGDIASTMAGTSAIVVISPRTWPPASHPWAITTSTPALAATCPSATLPTACRSRPPALCTNVTYGAGSPQNSEMMRTPARSVIATRSSCG
jgi:hypothetical protein